MKQNDEKLIELQNRCPFTITLNAKMEVFSAGKLYTVTSVYKDNVEIMANLLEVSLPVAYEEDNFQWIKMLNPN